jgi:hypothetical protein
MSKTRPPYTPEFRRQMVELVRAGRSPEEVFMRTIPLVAITFAALFLSSIGAHADGTWCAQYGTPGGGTNCGFYSFQQCQATVSGIGGFCMHNPFSAYGSAREPRRHYRRAR